MKFGNYLQENIVDEWRGNYLNYGELKRMIRVLADVESKSMAASPAISKWHGFSLTVPPPTNAAAQPQARKAAILGQGEGRDGADSDGEDDVAPDANITHEVFFEFLENEIQKVHNFTNAKVEEIRSSLKEVARRLGIDDNSLPGTPVHATEEMKAEVDKIGQDFLQLEKYVNLNYTGFHKILKKHDRWLTNPCRVFYLQRLQNHNWTRGDYSDVVVLMSKIWSSLRGDTAAQPVIEEEQRIVRSTTKYWVPEEMVSRVKYMVLQQLPVFLQQSSSSSPDKQPDCQLINSVYLDNATLELYKGRLEKSPGAIAVRFRWYGTGEPDTVFVERKTESEQWSTDVSLKERFQVKASEVSDLLKGRFDKAAHIQDMRNQGKSDREIEEWNTLVTEVMQAIVSKQLVPTLRTQYMRTAFQIPYDTTVRVSLDTNLIMLTEQGRLVLDSDRWYRDPAKPVPRNEITRFPHAVLEIKLQLKDASQKPQWVSDLVRTGMLQEIPKFSKFIHGCAVLLSDEVQAVPYWIDEPSMQESLIASGSERIMGGKLSGKGTREPEPMQRRGDRVDEVPNRPVANGTAPANKAELLRSIQEDHYEQEAGPGWCERCFTGAFGWARDPDVMGHVSLQKVEPKLFFANERTFIHWLNMAVTISSLGAAVLAFSPGETVAEVYGIILLPTSLIFALYALRTYRWRAKRIRTREPGRWDDPSGPVILGSVFTAALILNFLIKANHVLKYGSLA